MATAATVPVRDGELLMTDGPFAEIMEIVGGFYVLRAPANETRSSPRSITGNEPGR